MEEIKVDVAILGSGSAGLYSLSKVKPSGKSFVLINGGEAGTTCARVGCMPSKALIQIAEDFHRRTKLGRYGIDGHQGMTLDIPEALEHVQDMRDSFVDRVLTNTTDNMGDKFIEGYAKFIEPNLLEIDNGQRIRAQSIIIATGSHPVVPESWKAFGDRILTTDTLFEQESLPKSIAVIGLGVIGLELGQSLSRIGVDITGFDMATAIGGTQDPEVSQVTLEIMRKEFPIHLGEAVEITEEGEQLRVTAGEHSVVVDKVLASLGRAPNINNLDIEKSGASLDARGIPEFNRSTMQVGNLPLYIAGDVNGERQLLHEAGDEGRIAGLNAVSEKPHRFKRKTPIYINFCDPNICMVGARWDDLDHDTTAVGEVRLNPVGRAQIMGKNQGVIRVYGEQATGRLLGAEMITVKGENLAHLLTWCIQQDLTVGDVLRLPFYHPVIEEALQAALNDLYSKVDAKNAGAILELAELD